MAYEAREAELMDQRTRIKSAFAKGEEIGIKKGEELGIKKGEEIGIKKGIDEGKAEIIRALLAGGMRVEDVSAISGMDLTRVIEIQKGMPGAGR